MTDFPTNTTKNQAKLTWHDPTTQELREFVLEEGATAMIGRATGNDISIPEQHVSRQHAVISSKNGRFYINDLGSANGTFVNDKPVKQELFPLMHGDEIRLYVPRIRFATATDADRTMAAEHGTLITAAPAGGRAKLIITSGPQEGNTIPLLLDEMTIGRAVKEADWEIALQDVSVSRPHARLKLEGSIWTLFDLGSSNGTQVNGVAVTGDTGVELNDGDIVTIGATLSLFRRG